MFRCLAVLVALGSVGACWDCSSTSSGRTELQTIRDYLTTRYNDWQRSIFGNTTVNSLAFWSKYHEVLPIESSTLSRYLPSTHFYRTTLATSVPDYPAVSTLVSSVRTPHGWDIRTCLSPNFHRPSPEFLAQFQTLRATCPQDQQSISRAITALFASVTYNGRVGELKEKDGVYSVELWWNEMLFLLVQVRFEKDGSLSSVELRSPKQEQ